MRIVLYVLSAVLICIPHASLAANYDALLSNCFQKVDKYIDLGSRLEKAKNAAWYPQPLSDTKESVQNDLNKFLDDILKTLADNRALEQKKEIVALKREESRFQAELADLEMKRLVVPSKKKVYEVWKDDLSDMAEKIKRKKDQIETSRQRIADRKIAIRTSLADAGISFSAEAVDSLVNTVTGTDTIHAVVVFKNVQGVLSKLSGVMSETNENIHIAKKYYKIFLMSTQAYSHELTIFIERINAQYLPKLAALRAENDKLMTETRAYAKDDNKYLSNLKAQEITEKAAQKYADVLSLQKNRLAEQKQKVSSILMLAENTYKTVTIAHTLYDTMSEGLNNYESLMSLPLIDPIPFENKDLEMKYQELTQKLEQQ